MWNTRPDLWSPKDSSTSAERSAEDELTGERVRVVDRRGLRALVVDATNLDAQATRGDLAADDDVLAGLELRGSRHDLVVKVVARRLELRVRPVPGVGQQLLHRVERDADRQRDAGAVGGRDALGDVADVEPDLAFG